MFPKSLKWSNFQRSAAATSRPECFLLQCTRSGTFGGWPSQVWGRARRTSCLMAEVASSRFVTEGRGLARTASVGGTDIAMFSSATLAIDLQKTAETIEEAIRQQVRELRRRGVVVGLSGGIDSSVVTCLAVRALGAERVQVLLMPERDVVLGLPDPRPSALVAARRADARRRHRAHARSGRLLRPPGRSHPHDVPGLRRGVEEQDHPAVDPRQRPPELLGADRRVAERRAPERRA